MEFNGGVIEIKLDYGIVDDDFSWGCPPSVDGTSQGC